MKKGLVPNEIDVLASWDIELIPVIQMATFTLHVQRLSEAPAPGPTRELVPIGMMLGDLKALRSELERLIPAMERQLQSPETDTPRGAPGRH